MKPDRVRIVGQTFGIEYAPKPRGLSTDDAYGRTLLAEQRLLVRDDLAPDQERDTLLHEILHASLLVIGVEHDDKHETIVSGLAPVLLDVLRSNPQVTQYLMAGAA